MDQLNDLVTRSQSLPVVWISIGNGKFQATWSTPRFSAIKKFRSHAVASSWLREMCEACEHGRELGAAS